METCDVEFAARDVLSNYTTSSNISSPQGSPSRSPTKILDQYSGSELGGNLLIECKRQQMELKKHKSQIFELKRELNQVKSRQSHQDLKTSAASELEIALLDKLKLENELRELRQLMQTEQTSNQAKLMGLKVKITDLETLNKGLMSEISRRPLDTSKIFSSLDSDSSDISIPSSPVLRGREVQTKEENTSSPQIHDARKSIIPPRWTKSQPNLKENRQFPRSVCSQVSFDQTIDDSFLMKKARASALEPREEEEEEEEEDENTKDVDSIDLLESQVSGLGLIPPPIPDHASSSSSRPKLTPRRSRFTEDFSFEKTEATGPLDSMPLELVQEGSSRRWSDPRHALAEVESMGLSSAPPEDLPKTLLNINPVPAYESTFIGESRTCVKIPLGPDSPAKVATQPTVAFTQNIHSHTTAKPVAMQPRPSVGASAPDKKLIYEMVGKIFVGEYLYKTTKTFRKTEQHKRYFWVHPYTLTLYWDKQSPSSNVSAHHRPKSVPIMGVGEEVEMSQVNTGMFHKSIIVNTGKKNIRLTCNNQASHSVWLQSLRYILGQSESRHQTLQC